MAQNIFDATLDPNNDIKVNNFDWSHANNLTTQIGRITPIFCDMVPAKTSFRVNPRFGLQFMPMVFPIQTRMKARIMWFRYPLRALWKDYKDFVGNFREGLEEPYLNFISSEHIKNMGSTGSLGDYLGLPTTIVGAYGDNVNVPVNLCGPTGLFYGWSGEIPKEGSVYPPAFCGLGVDYSYIKLDCEAVLRDLTSKVTVIVSYEKLGTGVYSTISENSYLYAVYKDGTFSPAFAKLTNDDGVLNFRQPSGVAGKEIKGFALIFKTSYSNSGSHNSAVTDGNGKPQFTISSVIADVDLLNPVSDLSLETCPWYNSQSSNKDKQQKILAYAFRAYEGIYNSFIRDNRNNPYYLNGQVQYNKWIPTDEGGADTTLYELRYANWEKDFLTTAVQSPQQGNAPLVGITTYTQTVQNEDGTTTELVKTSLVDEDGKKYGLSFTQSDEGLEGVEYVELDNGTQVRQARSLYDLATSGISIPDLRMVNCYQKFLELNMRKGYSYKDIVEGRFDVKVRYADLLMPEFFGGVSRDIDVNSVTQTVDNNAVSGSGDYATALGSQSGIAGVRGEANANIECFCDEESIIMGLLIVTPLPVYTQLLPKHFTYRGLMEHYQPEFNLIGFQPIKYNEVCPIQAYNDNPDSLTDTFGYNRPWYEFAQKYDVAHGLFRTNLSNFLMHRVFDQKPQLAQSFLTVDPEQVTDVFAVTETTDKIYGQIWLDITCKLPIARVAIPRLD